VNKPTTNAAEAPPPDVLAEAPAPNLPKPELRGYEVMKRTRGGATVRVHTLKPTMIGFMQAKADVTYLNRRAYERKTGEMYFLNELVSAIWVPPAPKEEPLVLEEDPPEFQAAYEAGLESGAISEGGLPTAEETLVAAHEDVTKFLADARVENGAYDVVESTETI